MPGSTVNSDENYPLTDWRLILSPPAAGTWNMAVDHAILDAVDDQQVHPTLRLYAWDPPCLSLGISQPVEDVNMLALRERGWDLVRRPTGGRAILHTDELTYAVIGRKEEPRLVGSVLESYQRLSRALFTGLLMLGLPVEVVQKKDGAPDRSNPVCFEVPSDYEITVDGRKLLGSAQARQRSSVLQHGSLPLAGDLARITQVLAYPDPEKREEAARRVLSRAANVESILGYPVSWDQAAEAFQAAFQEALHIRFIPGELTRRELLRAETLREEKYSRPAWNERV